MGMGKILLIGGAVAGVAYLFIKHSEAHAASGGSASSAPPVPPAGAASMTVPPGPKNATGLTLTISQWQQQANPATGAKAGLWALVQNAANPSDFVVTFGDGKSAGIVQTGSTPNSKLIAQAFVGGLLN